MVLALAGRAASTAVRVAVGAVRSDGVCTAVLAVTDGPAVRWRIADHAVLESGDVRGKSQCLQGEGQGGEEELEGHHLD